MAFIALVLGKLAGEYVCPRSDNLWTVDESGEWAYQEDVCNGILKVEHTLESAAALQEQCAAQRGCHASCCRVASEVYSTGQDNDTQCEPQDARTVLLSPETNLPAASWRRPECTPFYLDEDGALSFRELEKCFLEAYGASMDSDFVEVVGTFSNKDAGTVEHLTDVAMLHALRAHPARTWDKEAALVHVTGLLPVLSHLSDADCKLQWTRQPEAAHVQRMEQAADTLEQRILSLGANGPPRIWVVFGSFYNTEWMLPERMLSLMSSPLGRRHIVQATQDLAFSADPHPYLLPNHVTIPYLPTYQLARPSSQPASAARAMCDPAHRNHSFFCGRNVQGRFERPAGRISRDGRCHKRFPRLLR